MLPKNATDLFQTADIAKPLFYLMITTQSEQNDISALFLSLILYYILCDITSSFEPQLSVSGCRTKEASYRA